MLIIIIIIIIIIMLTYSIFVFHEVSGISWTAEQLTAFQEETCCTELANSNSSVNLGWWWW